MRDHGSAILLAALVAIASTTSAAAQSSCEPPTPATLRAPQTGPAAARLPPTAPIPRNARDATIDRATRLLSFTTACSGQDLVRFYRGAMTSLYWHELSGMQASQREIRMEFQRGRTGMEITMRPEAAGARVVIQPIDAIEGPEAAAVAVVPSPPPAQQQPATALTAKAVNGLVIPQPSSREGQGRGLATFVTARVPAAIADIAAFYRRELAALGWKEEPGAALTGTQGRIRFTTPHGPGLLTLERSETTGLTDIRLRVVRERLARDNAMMTSPGRAVVVFGNQTDRPAAFEIAGRTVPVRPGIVPGLGAPETHRPPSVELSPGAHRLILRRPGQPALEVFVVLDEDSPWGIIAKRDGLEALPAY